MQERHGEVPRRAGPAIERELLHEGQLGDVEAVDSFAELDGALVQPPGGREVASLEHAHRSQERGVGLVRHLALQLDQSIEPLDLVVGVDEIAELDEGQHPLAEGVASDIVAAARGGGVDQLRARLRQPCRIPGEPATTRRANAVRVRPAGSSGSSDSSARRSHRRAAAMSPLYQCARARAAASDASAADPGG